MGQRPQRAGRIIRARQRSRTSLPAFTPGLDPYLEQIGVDRLQIAVSGSCTARSRTASNYLDLVSTPPAEADRLRAPSRIGNSLKLETATRPNSTLGHMRLTISGSDSRRYNISVSLHPNPTRTLAHLLRTHAEAGDFLGRLNELSPFEFFAQSSQRVPPAFGGDNWISDLGDAHRKLGSDPFAAFLPVFVNKIQALVSDFLKPTHASGVSRDGTDIVISDTEFEVRMNWGKPRVSQIECYFERHHSGALSAVRTLAVAALASLDHATVARYRNLTNDWVERQDDSLAVATKVTKTRTLSIYAKRRDRIRFEVKRNGKGDYSTLPSPTCPQQGLLDILNLERGNVLTTCRWPIVGALFEEVDHPIFSDFVRFNDLIARACANAGVSPRSLIEKLLEEGGVGPGDTEDIPLALMEELCDHGVLGRTSIRNRDRVRRDWRYTLKPEYRALIDVITAALIEQEARDPGS